MKKFLKSIYNTFRYWGFNPLKIYQNFAGLNPYHKDLKEFKRQRGDDNLFPFGRRRRMMGNRYGQGGKMRGHYFHQDLHVARRIFENQPVRHVDIGSRTDGFVAHVAAFREIELMDIRDIKSKVENIKFRRADLMQLPADMVDYCDSISSLHAMEHFGLGRYGDPIDYFGYIKGIQNVTKILKKSGTFYFAVPIGPQRIEFNAERIFSIGYLLDLLSESFEVIHFSYIDDKGDFHKHVSMEEQSIDNNMGCVYGCGIFELVKK